MLNSRATITGASRPAFVTAHATSHGDTVSSPGHRPAAAAAAAATATTASASGDPDGAGQQRIRDHRTASRVKTARSGPARPANRRSQPRTVAAGTPSSAAIRRCPRPRAAAASAAPITAA